MISEKETEKREKWTDRVRLWKETGLSAREWCKKNQVSPSNFYHWRRKLRRIESEERGVLNEPTPTFIEISQDKVTRQAGVELRVKDVTIRLDRDFDEQMLGQILGVLRRLPC